MAADHLQFLKDRFIREFHEAEEEFSDEFPLHPQFHDIEKFLQERSINPSTPIEMKNGLYDLIYELKECYMLAEKERDRQKERERKIQNMKSKFDVFTYNIKERMVMMPTTVKKRWFIYTTTKKLFRLKRNLELVKDDATTAAAQSSLLSDSVKVWNYSWVLGQAACNIHGLDEELQKIKALLLEQADDDDGIKTIGIVGMSGVGKTTLARMLVNDQDCCSVFSPIIWVTLSPNLNPSEIMRQLLETLSANDNDAQIISIIPDSLPEQLKQLQNRLCSKKYLIVLDNVWHQNEWYSDLGSSLQTDGTICINRLCHGLPKGGRGAVIVTSGLEEVAASMVGEHSLLKLQPLFDAEALWSMFMDLIQRKEFLTSDHHQRLSRMKEEIIDRCDGLLLAAKTLTEIISTRIGKQKYWSIGNVPKMILLISKQEATKTARTLRGVDDVSASFSAGEITITGRCLPLKIAKELGKSWPTELISVQMLQDEMLPDEFDSYILTKETVVELDLHDDESQCKAMRIVSRMAGIESVCVDMKKKKLTVVGLADPVRVIEKLRKYWPTSRIISIGPPRWEKKKREEKRETKMLFSFIFRCFCINQITE